MLYDPLGGRSRCVYAAEGFALPIEQERESLLVNLHVVVHMYGRDHRVLVTLSLRDVNNCDRLTVTAPWSAYGMLIVGTRFAVGASDWETGRNPLASCAVVPLPTVWVPPGWRWVVGCGGCALGDQLELRHVDIDHVVPDHHEYQRAAVRESLLREGGMNHEHGS